MNTDDDATTSELTPITEDSKLPARRLRNADLPKVTPGHSRGLGLFRLAHWSRRQASTEVF
jgi:hypothetical protein